MPPTLTYALLALCGAVFAFSCVLDFVRRPAFARLRRYSVWMSVVAMAGAYALLVPGRGDDGRAALRESSVAGKPLFMEFFSNT